MSIKDEKAKLRRKLLAERAAIEGREIVDAAMAIGAILLPFLKQRGIVHLALYSSFRDELSFGALAASWPADEIYYPRIEGGEGSKSMRMLAAPLSTTNRYGILEPAADARPMPLHSSQSAVIVPGLAFDRWGHRMGYGAGYYDRFLQGFSGISIGTCMNRFQLSALPHEDHDQTVAYIATEQGLRAAGL